VLDGPHQANFLERASRLYIFKHYIIFQLEPC